jgi:hypothetical protein
LVTAIWTSTDPAKATSTVTESAEALMENCEADSAIVSPLLMTLTETMLALVRSIWLSANTFPALTVWLVKLRRAGSS